MKFRSVSLITFNEIPLVILSFSIKRTLPEMLLIEAVVQRCSVKKVFLEISQNSQEKTFATVSFLLKKRLWHGSFPVNFEKFLRTSFYIEHLRWLLLYLLHTLFRSKRRAAIVTLFKNKRFISKTTIYTLHYRCNQ